MKENLKEWFIKRNKRIAGFTGVGVFVIIVIWSLWHSNKTLATFANRGLTRTNTRTKTFQSETCYCVIEYNKCKITCDGVNESILEEEIFKVSKNCEKNVIDLQIQSSFKENQAIGEYWLSRLEQNVHALIFRNCKINFIHESAFKSYVFQQLYELTLEETELRYLEIKTFEQFRNITTLNIRFNEFKPYFFVEAGLLANYRSLVILQFQNCLNGEHLLNITGSKAGKSKLTSLIDLDLRFNRLYNLQPQSFIQASYALVSLHLSNSEIETIHPNAFDGLSKVQGLHLEKNHLETLKEGTFNMIKHYEHNNGSIYLYENIWVCDCKLLWLKNLYVHENSTINQNMKLVCGDETPFSEASFQCSETTEVSEETDTNTTTDLTTNSISTSTDSSSTSNGTESTDVSEVTEINTTTEFTTSSTSISTDSSSTSTSPSTSTIKPSDCENANYVKEIPDKENVLEQKNIRVRVVPINILVTHVEASIHTFLEIDGSIDELNLFWFNTFNQSEAKCLTNLRGVVPMTYWKHNGVYTVCLLDKNTPEVVSPFSCAGINVPEDWENRTWIPNKKKITILIVTPLVITSAILVSGLSVFFLLRKYPNLLKGSKRIVMVGSRVTNAVVMPKEYSKPNYTPSPISGYMTPNNPIYDSIPSRSSSRRQRSYSDTSNASYINPNFKNFVFKRPIPERFLFENDCIPPPLPPFHPKMKNCIQPESSL